MNCDRHDVHLTGAILYPATILRQNPGSRFLEIGVGPTFRQERFRAINDFGIHHVGLDFEHVCAGPTWPRPASPIETSPF